MIEVEVMRVFFDFVSASAMVILVNKEGDKVMPIWIGVFEAQSIQSALDGESFKRPMTHDLLKNVIAASGGKLDYVLISKVIDNTFYSRIYIERLGAETDIDARPSDALCMAVKTGAKIFVDDRIYDKFEPRVDFEKKLKNDFYSMFLGSINKNELKKA
ncbi:bifunctional nuclease family protein [bacterium]|nr:bifunctional nuclease family protein [bacterium]MBU3956278.1 bifunctional nuclease family protein [bacterium]